VEEAKEILKNTVMVLNRTEDLIEEIYLRSREYQKRLDLLGTDWDEQREKWDESNRKWNESIEAQKEKA